MKLIIYTLPNCKVCEYRVPMHNAICDALKELGIDTLCIQFGTIDGATYLPLEEHDSLCRKPEDPMKYTAPVYIYEDDNNRAKLADPKVFETPENYVEHIKQVVSNLNEGTE